MESGKGKEKEGYKASSNVLGLVIGAIMLYYGVSYQVFLNNIDINFVYDTFTMFSCL